MISMSEVNEEFKVLSTTLSQGATAHVTMNQHLATLLGPQLYSEYFKTMPAELLQNAMDAMVAAGISNPVVTVKIPCAMDDYFYVQDQGIGASPEEVAKYFLGYGESSKRHSNAFMGHKGIGMKIVYKEPLVSIDTVKNGKLFSCVVKANEQGIPSMYPITVDTKGNPATIDAPEHMKQGTRIGFRVKASDIKALREGLVKVLYWYDPKSINAVGDPSFTWNSVKVSKQASSNPQESGLFLKQGNEGYPLKLHAFSAGAHLTQLELNEMKLFFEVFSPAVYEVPMGTVMPNATRENLEVSNPMTIQGVKSLYSRLNQSLIEGLEKLQSMDLQESLAHLKQVLGTSVFNSSSNHHVRSLSVAGEWALGTILQRKIPVNEVLLDVLLFVSTRHRAIKTRLDGLSLANSLLRGVVADKSKVSGLAKFMTSKSVQNLITSHIASPSKIKPIFVIRDEAKAIDSRLRRLLAQCNATLNPGDEPHEVFLIDEDKTMTSSEVARAVELLSFYPIPVHKLSDLPTEERKPGNKKKKEALVITETEVLVRDVDIYSTNTYINTTMSSSLVKVGPEIWKERKALYLAPKPDQSIFDLDLNFAATKLYFMQQLSPEFKDALFYVVISSREATLKALGAKDLNEVFDEFVSKQAPKSVKVIDVQGLRSDYQALETLKKAHEYLSQVPHQELLSSDTVEEQAKISELEKVLNDSCFVYAKREQLEKDQPKLKLIWDFEGTEVYRKAVEFLCLTNACYFSEQRQRLLLDYLKTLLA